MQFKYESLNQYIRNLKGVVVAFSGGVDSTFLLAAAVDALGDRALAVVGCSPTHPLRERQATIDLARQIGAQIEFVETHEMVDEEFTRNPPNRCFTCKTILLKAIWRVARQRGYPAVLEGSNFDDLGDFRPGLEAVRQLQVKSPLIDFEFSKAEIRNLSRTMALPTWNKPAFACLSSRIPYGQRITLKKLKRIEQAEDILCKLGFSQFRVRDYEDLCRIEVPAPELINFMDLELKKEVISKLKQAGYRFICLDLEGYRTGSMNETLSETENRRFP